MPLSKYEKKNCGNYDNAIVENGRKKNFVCDNGIVEIGGGKKFCLWQCHYRNMGEKIIKSEFWSFKNQTKCMSQTIDESEHFKYLTVMQ